MRMRTYTKKYAWKNTKLLFKVMWKRITFQPVDTNELKFIKFLWDIHIEYYKVVFNFALELARQACDEVVEEREELIGK